MSERWVEFEGRPHGNRSDEPRVTLSNRDVLTMNKAAYEALGSPAAVTLMYEEDKRMIGIKPGDTRRSNSFPVKQCSGKTAKSRKIHLHPFCHHCGIKTRQTVLFNDVDFDNAGMMRLDLNGTSTIGKTERIRN